MVNFFLGQCQEVDISDMQFGICDDKNNTAAYVDRTEQGKWIAIVNNPYQRNIRFTAIDNCVDIRRSNGEMDSRCDAMLDYEENIVFIELKDQRSSWLGEGLNQIEASIVSFRANHDLSQFKYKIAFVANKRHRRFEVIENEQKKRFFDTYKVRINAQADIAIK